MLERTEVNKKLRSAFTIAIPFVISDSPDKRKIGISLGATPNINKACFGDSLCWRKTEKTVKNNDSKSADYISVNALFENKDNFENERKYFYPEIFELFYELDYCTYYVLTPRNSDGVLIGPEAEMSIIGDNHRYSVRKLYICLYNNATAQLVIEGNNGEFDDEYRLPEKVRMEVKGQIYELNSFLKLLLGLGWNESDRVICEKKQFYLPFQNQSFMTKFIYDEMKDENKELPFGIVAKGKTEVEMAEIMGNKMMIYLLVIQQKVSILKYEAQARRVSIEKKDRDKSKKLRNLIESYVVFLNQFNTLECSFEESGKKWYEYHREKLNIKNEWEQLDNQISKFEALEKGKQDDRLNAKMKVLTMLSVPIGLLQIVGTVHIWNEKLFKDGALIAGFAFLCVAFIICVIRQDK